METDHETRLVGLEESLGTKKPGDFIPLVKAKRATKGSPTKRPKSSLRAAVTTSESSSLELARLRRKSLPATPDGRSVREDAQRFKELEDQFNKPVDHHNQKELKEKESKEKELKEKLLQEKESKTTRDIITVKDSNNNSDEAAASALLQIAHETSMQLGQPKGQELEPYTPLTKAALEVFDLQSMQHMNEKELAKQKIIRDQRLEKE